MMMVFVLFFTQFFSSGQPQPVKECACEYEIDFGIFGKAKAPCELPSAQVIETEMYRTEINILSCQGKSSFKSYDRKTGRLKVTGNFIDCSDYSLGYDTLYVLNEETYEEELYVTLGSHCKPVEDGEWHYFND